MKDSRASIEEKQIYLQNLEMIAHEQQLLSQEKELFLREYYTHIVKSGNGLSEVASSLLVSFQQRSKNDDIEEKTLLAQLLSECFSERDLMAALNEKEYSLTSSAKIACWTSNQYSSLAYERFASLSPFFERYSAESFFEVCEWVGSGQCDFGILPLENSSNGRLIGFYKLLDQYELKINAVCQVEHEDGEDFTRFALISRNHFCPLKNTSRLIELSVTSVNAVKMLELLEVARAMQMKVTRLFSLPLHYRRNACLDAAVLWLPMHSYLPFFMYLYLFGRDITILGLYIEV